MARSVGREFLKPGAIVIAVLLWGLLSIWGSGCAQSGSKGSLSSGKEQGEFPAFVYASRASLASYQSAVAMSEAFSFIPCYCNCKVGSGHTDLKDCFIESDGSFDKHGSTCHVCQEEAADVRDWKEQGMSVKEIRTLIDQKFARYGVPTDTPMPR
ncbi:MAG: hypothetical protein HY664_08325 [Chloroflexi bacterium]|nr:hypothetical protein [Chloroflexota bacterium]